MSRYTLHARSGLLIAGLLLLPAAPVAAEGQAAVPTVKIEPQLRARSHASEATIEAVRQATVAAQVQGRVLEARVDAGARVRGKQFKFATNAFFFQEGHEPVFRAAKYGEFRVGDSGEPRLVALLDAQLKRLGENRF